MPAHSIRETKGAALPSMIGISGPSTSISTLSILHPARAEVRCSIVLTVAPWSFPTVVARRVSITFRQLTTISRAPLTKSIRQIRMPKPSSAGFNVSDVFLPECRATPVQPISVLSVFCLITPAIFTMCSPEILPLPLLKSVSEIFVLTSFCREQLLGKFKTSEDNYQTPSEELKSTNFTVCYGFTGLTSSIRLATEKCRYFKQVVVRLRGL